MSKIITIANIEPVTGKGRPVTAKTRKIRTSIINYLRRCETLVTTNQVAKGIKQSKHNVIAQLRWLEGRGVIEKAGSVKVSKHESGRPSAVWKVLETGVPADMTSRLYKQKQREFIRIMTDLTPEHRGIFVQECLRELLERQDDDEIEAEESIYRNKKGFTAYDAKQGTIDALKEQLGQAEIAYWLTDRRLFKYHKQLGF